jgi:thiol-disulfide isomerase/thioredoxin
LNRKILSFILVFSIYLNGQPQNSYRDQIEVNEINLSELNQIIKNRAGKILIINIWATWCIPCKDEFPDLIKLSDKYREKIDLIGISIDFPDEIDSKVKPFLQKMQVNFINYVNSESDVEKFINNLNPEWSGAIPATFIYEPDGRQIADIEGIISFEEIEDLLLKTIN